MDLRKCLLGIYALNEKKRREFEIENANFQYAPGAVVAELTSLELCCCSKAASA